VSRTREQDREEPRAEDLPGRGAVHDGQERGHVGLDDQAVEEALRSVHEGADVVVAAAQVTAPDGERAHRSDRDHVVEVEGARGQPLHEELSILEAGRLAAEANLEGNRRDEAKVR